jgi:hypothetical protein
MVSTIDWSPAYRLIASKYPTVSVYDRISSARNFTAILELEALTNPRAREEAGDYRKVRAADAISGPGSTPIMASFAYSGPSRFTDGSYGFWTDRFLRATHEPSIDVDKRVYCARIRGAYDDIRGKSKRSMLYDPDSYAASQRYAHRLYAKNAVDGIVYRSVRRPQGSVSARSVRG